MRLTADLVDKSASFINAVHERELDLRGNRIPAIENFGVVKDAYDTIDLTDNEIRRLENFPKMLRLKSLFCSSNQIVSVNQEVGQKLASLEMLVLNNNKISEFEELDGLKECKTLRYLSLLDNPITKKPHYRLTVISQLPQLRCLDFRKVSQAEREAADELVTGKSSAKPTAAKGRGRRAAVKTAEAAPAAKRQKLSAAEREKIKAQIAAADNFEEVSRLEKILETGYNL